MVYEYKSLIFFPLVKLPVMLCRLTPPARASCQEVQPEKTGQTQELFRLTVPRPVTRPSLTSSPGEKLYSSGLKLLGSSWKYCWKLLSPPASFVSQVQEVVGGEQWSAWADSLSLQLLIICLFLFMAGRT